MATFRKQIIIPGFLGGVADSISDPLQNQTFQTSKDLDTFSSVDTMKPFIKLANDAACSNTNKLQVVYKASNGTYYFLGNSGTSNQLRVFRTSALSSSSTLTTVGTSTTSNTAPDTTGLSWIAEYKGYLYFWNTSTSLSRVKLSDNTYTESWQTGLAGNGPIFTHEGLGLLCVGALNTVATYDNTTFTAAALTLDDKWRVRSISSLGRFVPLGCADANDGATSRLFIWNGSASTLEDIIDVGDVGLQAIRNVNGTIHILTAATQTRGSALRLYIWSGQGVQLVKEFPLSNTAQLAVLRYVLDSAVDVFKDTLYWGFNGVTSNSIGVDNLIYAYGRSIARRPKAFVQARLNSTPDTTNIQYTCVKQVDGTIVVLWNDGTNWKMDHEFANSTTGQLSANGVYQSNAFYLDDSGERPGKIKTITINHKPLVASTGFTVSHKNDMASDWATVGSQTTAGTTKTIFRNLASGQPFPIAKNEQLQIAFDTVSGTSGPEIIWPIIIDVEVYENISS